MQQNNIEVRVVIKNRPINEYLHEGEMFVEGRGGSNYEIELKNLNNHRVEAILAVDGLSVIDGKEAGPQSTGYLLEARETLRVPGWMLTNEQVAAFQFAGKKKSYASASVEGDVRNTGVIGVMAFKPKAQQYAYPKGSVGMFPPRIQPYPYGGTPRGIQISASGGYGYVGGEGIQTLNHVAPSGAAADLYRSAVNSASLDGPTGTMGNSGPCGDPGTFIGASLSGDFTSSNNMSYGAAETKTSGGMLRASTVATPELAPVEQTLGTAFGQATEFKTTEVEFDRGDLLSMIVLYYDDAKGLRARGIDLDRRKQNPRVAEQPKAFPGLTPKGCVPPTGWKG